MKTLLFLSLSFLGLINGCHEQKPLNVPQQGDTISIGYKERYSNTTNDITLKFDSVLEDSRCPDGATCVWAGNAKVQLVLGLNNKKDTFALNTNANMPSGDNFVTANGYKISLIDLSPHLKLNEDIHLPQSYRVEISINK
ncbi:MAG: hypothetical protein PHV20_01090 [Bacteroidales bacterium]|nr:hypothetical protein [Bacteroidales bacterium]